MPLPLDSERTTAIYLNLSEGKVRQKVDESTPGATSRIVMNPSTKENKTVWEKVYQYAEGYVEKIQMYTDDFNRKLIEVSLFLQDNDEHYILKINSESGYGSAFMEIAPNIDFSKPIRILGYSFVPEGKTKNKTGVNIFQPTDSLDLTFGNKLPKKWTKENPGDKPQWNPDDIEQWQLDTKRFLTKYMNEHVIPAIKVEPWNSDGERLFDKPEKSIKEQVMEKQPKVEESDDLPF